MKNLTGTDQTNYPSPSALDNPFRDINWEISKARRAQMLTNYKKLSDENKKNHAAAYQAKVERRKLVAEFKECAGKVGELFNEARQEVRGIVENLQGASAELTTFIAENSR